MKLLTRVRLAPLLLAMLLIAAAAQAATGEAFWIGRRAGVSQDCQQRVAHLGGKPAEVAKICACMALGFEKSLEAERAAIEALPTDEERNKVLAERLDSYWAREKMDPFVPYCRAHPKEFGLEP